MKTLIYTHTCGDQKSTSLKRVFNDCGIHTDICDSGEHFLYLAMSGRYTAVIVSAPLPLPELRELHKEWQQIKSTSLFMVITTNQSGLQRGQALSSGVNKYYIEPCSYSGLIKDIYTHELTQIEHPGAVHTTEYFSVDVIRRTITFRGKTLQLTRKEFEILSYLLRKRGYILSRVQIWEEIWGYNEYPMANTIDVHINRLRRKLPEDARSYLNTVHGMGYRIMAEA